MSPVFENYSKCRQKLIKNAKIVIENPSLRSKSVTRQVIFDKTKIDEKCQNFKMRHF